MKYKGNTQITHMEETEKYHRVIRLLPLAKIQNLINVAYFNKLGRSPWKVIKKLMSVPLWLLGILEKFTEDPFVSKH